MNEAGAIYGFPANRRWHSWDDGIDKKCHTNENRDFCERGHEREFQTWNKDLMADLEDMDIGYPRCDGVYIRQRGLYLTFCAQCTRCVGREPGDGWCITEDEGYLEEAGRANAPRKYRLGRFNLLLDVSPEK